MLLSCSTSKSTLNNLTILIFRMVDDVSAPVVSNQSINFTIICYIHQWYLINRQTPPRIFTYFFIHLLSDKVGLVVVVKYTLISWIMDLMQSQREYETARIGNQRIECENELTLFGSDTSYSMWYNIQCNTGSGKHYNGGNLRWYLLQHCYNHEDRTS